MKRTFYVILSLILLSTPLILFSQNDPDWIWVQHVQGGSLPEGTAIALDNQGNIYSGGCLSGQMTFGNTVLTGYGLYDFYVAKMDAQGNWIWAVSATGPEDTSCRDLYVDQAGNCYVLGHYRGWCTFGNITVTSTSTYAEICVAKLDAQGNWIWAVSAGGIGTDQGNGITVDLSGSVYITGLFNGTANFGNFILTSNAGSRDMFVAKLDYNGNWLWAISAGSSGMDSGMGICIADVDNIYVTGYFYYTASFGDCELTSYGSSDVFVAKLDTNGNWIWVKQAGGTLGDNSHDIDSDASGNIYVIGIYKQLSTFDNITINNDNDSTDVFIAKLNSSGDWLWVRQSRNSPGVSGTALSCDSNGNSYFTGTFSEDVLFGNIQLYNGFWDKRYIAKLTTNGVWDWAVDLGGDFMVTANELVVDNSGNIYLTGSCSGTATFGNIIISISGTQHMYTAKLSENVTEAIDEADIEPDSMIQKMIIYPNPVRKGQTITITDDSDKREFEDIFIHNLKGQMIEKYNVRLGNNKFNLNTANLAPGVYFIRNKNAKLKTAMKFVVLH